MKIPNDLPNRQKDLLRILFKNAGISQKELSDLMENSITATSNIIKKVSEYEPPLIRKEQKGKYHYYFLTDYGKAYLEALDSTYETNVKEVGNIPSYNLSKPVKRFLRLLYLNRDGLNIKELNKLLGDSSLTATCNLKSVISNYNPPLIRKKGDGTYFLTPYGEKCCESFDFFNDIETDVTVVAINDDLKRIIITNILNGISNDNQDFLVLGLKNLSIDAIMSTFDLTEFYFLCLLLGIITDPMSLAEAASLILPDSSIEERTSFSRIIYQKLNNLITEEFINKRFNLSSNELKL